MSDHPASSLDNEVLAWLDLTDKIEELEAERARIKTRLAAFGPGQHVATGGVVVTVGAPPRRFNRDRAWAFLTEDQKDVCTSPDDKKIKAQLAPVLLEECMDAGTGAARVTIR